MNALIDDAIRTKRRLRFVYNGKARIVEPQCHGIGTKGTELLRAYMSGGGAERAHVSRGSATSEPLFDVAKMQDLAMLDETFERPGPHYTRDDSAMVTIFTQL